MDEVSSKWENVNINTVIGSHIELISLEEDWLNEQVRLNHTLMLFTCINGIREIIGVIEKGGYSAPWAYLYLKNILCFFFQLILVTFSFCFLVLIWIFPYLSGMFSAEIIHNLT